MSYSRVLLTLAIAFALASCSHPPSRHPTVVISETRSLNEKTATGQARVFASPSPHARLAAARAWLAIADALATTPAGSYQAALRGVTELGTDYAESSVRDETTTKELLARDEFEEQHDDLAAELMLGILRSRILMYEHRYQREVE